MPESGWGPEADTVSACSVSGAGATSAPVVDVDTLPELTVAPLVCVESNESSPVIVLEPSLLPPPAVDPEVAPPPEPDEEPEGTPTIWLPEEAGPDSAWLSWEMLVFVSPVIEALDDPWLLEGDEPLLELDEDDEDPEDDEPPDEEDEPPPELLDCEDSKDWAAAGGAKTSASRAARTMTGRMRMCPS